MSTRLARQRGSHGSEAVGLRGAEAGKKIVIVPTPSTRTDPAPHRTALTLGVVRQKVGSTWYFVCQTRSRRRKACDPQNSLFGTSFMSHDCATVNITCD